MGNASDIGRCVGSINARQNSNGGDLGNLAQRSGNT